MAFAVLAAFLLATPWVERLAARIRHEGVPSPPSPRNGSHEPVTAISLVAELRAFIQTEVESAITTLNERERAAGSDETYADPLLASSSPLWA